MFPILVNWGPVVLPAWHTFYVLGATFAFWLMLKLRRLHAPEIPEAQIARIYIVCYVGGYFGARLLSIFIEERQITGFVDTLVALTKFGAMTFYGGAIASFVGGILYVKWQRLSLGTCADLGMPAGLLALAIGRIGCFLNGDDYGLPVKPGPNGEAPFYGIVFPNLADGVARHAVQLYETLAVAALVLGLVLAFQRLRKALKPGAVALFGAIGYANLRFFLEFFRGDFRGFAFGTWLSTSQFVSILVLVAAASTLPYWLKKQPEAPA